MNYYNDNNKFAYKWLQALIDANLIPEGKVDDRSITDIKPSDLKGFRQCHFFAGIAGWSYALRLADWPEDREVWTGSCPCQPFSVAGKGEGPDDERHLWPAFRWLIAQRRPATVFGEQVASALGRLWLNGVRTDLEAMGYAVGAADLCAAGVGAPHIRQRLWWVGDASGKGRGAQRGDHSEHDRAIPDPTGERVGVPPSNGRRQERQNTGRGPEGSQAQGREQRPWDNSVLIRCADGKWRRVPGRLAKSNGARPLKRGETAEGTRHGRASESGRGGAERWEVEPSLFPLADGVPNRVGLLRGAGNAIVPQVAAEFIKAYAE